jgi:hypothetical protein
MRHAVPYACTSRPPIVTVCRYSRQYWPWAFWYVWIGVIAPELPVSGFSQTLVWFVFAYSSEFCAELSINQTSWSS